MTDGAGACSAASGSGNAIAATLDLGVGETATFTISGTVEADATGTLSNTASATPPVGISEDAPGNNTATDTDNLTPVTDLSITKTDSSASEIPGTVVSYAIVVTNNGPSDVVGASVADEIPSGLTGATWTCSVASGEGSCADTSDSGDIATTVDLKAGKSATFTIDASISPTATGTLSNTASVSPPVGTNDPTPGNNSATDSDDLIPTGDLSITKTDGSTTAVPGAPISYTLTVSNSGPSAITGASVSDNLPAAITGGSWNCSTDGAGSCATASGTGDLATTVDLNVGETATIVIGGTVSASATGSLSNTATVAVPGGSDDPTPGNNTATDTDTLTPLVDLIITKTDGQSSVEPQATPTYTITVTNAGPSDVTGAAVSDLIPAGLTSASWTCAVAVGEGSCADASGSGDIATAVNLKAGKSATFVLDATVADGSSGSLSNTANVSPPIGTTDISLGNNSATDTDTVTPKADLAITKTSTPHPFLAGNALTYTITARTTAPRTSRVLS